jgi:ribulose 1,5-bisphosphate carboxylase large subunit-like protein
MRQAVDATMEGKKLEEYPETHKELEAALELWKD